MREEKEEKEEGEGEEGEEDKGKECLGVVTGLPF